MRQIGLEIQSWPLLKLLVKTGHTWTHGAVLFVNLTEGGNTGRGEASDVDCLGEPDESMYQQVLGLQKQQEQGGAGGRLQTPLPAVGARHAIDCALWDLEAKTSCLDWSELEEVAEHYQMMNTKLDKTSGLTEALILAENGPHPLRDNHGVVVGFSVQTWGLLVSNLFLRVTY